MQIEFEKMDYASADWSQIDAALIGLDAKQSARDYWLGKCLIQIAERRLYALGGFSTLANYMEIRLGWDPHTTAERLRTARDLEALPLIAAELREGRIRWTAAREMSRIATRRTEAEWIEFCRGKNTHTIAMAVKARRHGQRPSDPADPALLRMTIKLECDSEEYAFLRAAIASVRESLGEEGRALSEAACLRLLLSDRVEKMQVDLTVCPSCRAAGVRTKGEILPIERVVGSEAMCCGRVVAETGEILSRHVPEPTERAVMIRANGKCEVPGCRNGSYLRTHHVKLWSEGGRHTFLELMVLCDGHHRLHHQGVLLIEGSRLDGFVFRHADGTEIGRPPEYDRARAFTNAFAALHQVGLREGDVRKALRQVREEGKAITEEQILFEASRILTAQPDEMHGAMKANESEATYAVPWGTQRRFELDDRGSAPVPSLEAIAWRESPAIEW